MNAKHTPNNASGWRMVEAEDGWEIQDAQTHDVICTVGLEDSDCFESDLNDPARANAQLIASSPAMREALEFYATGKQDNGDFAKKVLALSQPGNRFGGIPPNACNQSAGQMGCRPATSHPNGKRSGFCGGDPSIRRQR